MANHTPILDGRNRKINQDTRMLSASMTFSKKSPMIGDSAKHALGLSFQNS